MHEPAYLVEDARAAVLEARRSDIRTCCIAVDPHGEGYVCTIFGWNSYRVVDDACWLPAHLADLYSRLAMQ